ncbi:hypothetical protein PGTUg99_033731, partial [Puccinia graminis f. sp. tritici]
FSVRNLEIMWKHRTANALFSSYTHQSSTGRRHNCSELSKKKHVRRRGVRMDERIVNNPHAGSLL